MSGNSLSKVVVWDAEGPPPAGDWITVLWNNYASQGDNPDAISIPEQLEYHADELRESYLAWVYDLGEMHINGKSVIDHLKLRPGFSYWWMSSLAQKFNASESSKINDALKAMALEKQSAIDQATLIELYSDNFGLAVVLEAFSRKKKIKFKWWPKKKIGRRKSKNRYLYCSLSALIYFVWYIFKSLPLIIKNKGRAPILDGKVIFFDVLAHLNKQSFVTGQFASNYWTALVDKLKHLEIKSSWLHLFFRHSAVPSLSAATDQIDCFNSSSLGWQVHALLESRLSISLLFRSLRDYFTIRKIYRRLSNIYQSSPLRSSLDLWPFHINEWQDSLCGKDAIKNCLMLNLFENALKNIPTKNIGIYILENQPWEMALAFAWRSAGHKTLIGVPHTCVRYWDLRYHYDQRSYESISRTRLPMPDILAVNGPVAMREVLASHYPPSKIAQVEALRFLHISKFVLDNKQHRSPQPKLHVLICADFRAETTRLMLSWLEIAISFLPKNVVFVFKPHPAYSLDTEQFSSLNLVVSDATLGELLTDSDVVFASNSTSAAVDAYCLGVPVIQMLDGNSINLSPLRGIAGIMFAADSGTLFSALLSIMNFNCANQIQYFNLDEELPGWLKLLTAT